MVKQALKFTETEIIKREELSKKVWEDNGVFVGRSLDTYVSKLRKKLKQDSALKIINVHGVGYKLEVTKIERVAPPIPLTKTIQINIGMSKYA